MFSQLFASAFEEAICSFARVPNYSFPPWEWFTEKMQMRAINLILLRNNFFPPEEPWWISCLWSHRTDFAQAVSRESVCWHFATAAFTFKMYLMWNYWRIPRLRLRSEAESAKKREASNRKVTSALYLRWLTWFESRVHLLHSHNEKLISALRSSRFISWCGAHANRLRRRLERAQLALKSIFFVVSSPVYVISTLAQTAQAPNHNGI